LEHIPKLSRKKKQQNFEGNRSVVCKKTIKQDFNENKVFIEKLSK